MIFLICITTFFFFFEKEQFSIFFMFLASLANHMCIVPVRVKKCYHCVLRPHIDQPHSVCPVGGNSRTHGLEYSVLCCLVFNIISVIFIKNIFYP